MDNPELLTLGETQLALLGNPRYQVSLLVAQFSEARNPSEVARLIGWPANRVHYWVKRLHEAGLLVRVDSVGRRHSYRVAARRYRVPLSLLPHWTMRMPAATTEAVGRLARGLTAESYRWLGALSEIAVKDDRTGERFVEFGIADRVLTSGYEPALQTLRVRLTAGKYARLLNKLTALLAEFGDEVEQEGDLCTLAVIGYRDP